MTRLSEALSKAANTPVPEAAPAPPAPATTWQFSPVETMYVPDEPSDFATSEPESLRRIDSGQIPVGNADRHKLVIGQRVDPNVVEQYRHLAAVLHHAQKSSGAKSVMVTSAVASEGKTLTATNLALTLSQSYQRRVLLIDADLRRPRIREVFALPATAGLTDTLADSRTEQLPVHQITPTLWVLTAGGVVPDPMSMLVSPAMKQLLDEASQAFDWVVVDTPPVAILPDANLLAAMIDKALLVVSAQSTPYPMVQRAAEKVGAQRILGVILNRVARADLVDGYYGYQGYHQRPTRPARPWWRWRRRPQQPAPSAPA